MRIREEKQPPGITQLLRGKEGTVQKVMKMDGTKETRRTTDILILRYVLSVRELLCLLGLNTRLKTNYSKRRVWAGITADSDPASQPEKTEP